MSEQIIQIEQVALEELKPDAFNPRRITDAELEALTRSITEFGFVDPIIARTDGVILGGHQRLLAARKVGLRTVPVIYLAGLSEERSRLLNLALNKIGGRFDDDLLARLLKDLSSTPDLDLSLAGFAEDEVTKLLRKLDAREKRSRFETFDFLGEWEAAQTAGVRPGDLYALGEHRLLCGSATSLESCDRLLGGGRARMAFTDPPYNVDYRGAGGKRRRAIANDAMSPAAWRTFVTEWSANILRFVDGSLYICMASKEWPVVAAVLEACGGHWSDTLIWAKDRFVLGRADYQRQYEPIWYGWREGATRHWGGHRDQGDVWTIARPSESELHPTMKPVALVERAIENSSEAGDMVLDLFVGSGTTLIAAERTGRVCYAMELDPRYCSLAIARWQAFTGAQARKVAADGE